MKRMLALTVQRFAQRLRESAARVEVSRMRLAEHWDVNALFEEGWKP